MTFEEAAGVVDRHDEELMALEGVVGVYVGALPDSTPCIKILVTAEPSELKRKIPATLEGLPVILEPTEPIRPMERGSR